MPTIEMTADPSRLKRRDHIRVLSRTMAVLCMATSVLLSAALLFYWLATPASVLFAQVGLNSAMPADIGLVVRATAFGISMMPLGALIYGLLNARRCFSAFAVGQIFSVETVGRLRAFAIAIMASAILKPLAGAALSVLLSWNAPSGAKTLALNIGSDTLLALIFAGTVAVIAWVMTDAIAIADENAQFV